jgi:outer membrane protein OmpA-like peptidoglycan-associated protein/opacity protein-like surface antigen
MLHIKKIVVLILFSGFFFTASAQTSQQDYNDIKPFTGTSPFRKFSIGLNVGATAPSVIFGGSNDFAKPQIDLGYGANIRYQINHYLALQADYLGGKLKGTQDDIDFAQTRLVKSFETKLKYAASLSGVVTFDNINWLNQKNHVVPYVSVGLGFTGYDTKIVKMGSNTEEDYTDNISPDNPLFVPVGVGFKINLSRLINLDLGYRMNFVDADNVDGSPYWSDPVSPSASKTHFDKFSYGFVGLEFALGKQSKPQLLFDNPVARLNTNLQTQIDTVREDQKKLSTDSDGDGVSNMFDKEPNTPSGCPVDAQGVTRDTDGDGVPDCKDKELVTPTQCQPVDADGIGKCPEPDCCKAIMDSLATMNTCNLSLPSITFRGNRSSSLSSDAKAMLASVASQLKNSASCSIMVTGYPAASKASQSLCNRRVEAIKAYLVETEGIGAERITVNCEVGGGDANTVDIHAQ